MIFCPWCAKGIEGNPINSSTDASTDIFPSCILSMFWPQLSKFSYFHWLIFINESVLNRVFWIQVTPIYKNGDITEPGNYRPISILSPFSKGFEKVTYNQLYRFVEKREIMYKYQFGCRKGYSTEQAILEITDALKKAMDKKLIACGLFLDFSKACETVNRDNLLSKLYHYGVCGSSTANQARYLRGCHFQVMKMGSVKCRLAINVCAFAKTMAKFWFSGYIIDIFAVKVAIFCSGGKLRCICPLPALSHYCCLKQ